MSDAIERERFLRLSALFDELDELSPGDRRGRLDLLAASDPDLSARARALFAADERAGDFLLEPAEVVLRTLVEGAVADDEAPLEGKRFGPWRLLARIGRGGMGEVWEVERADGAYELRAALKLLRRGLDTDDVLRRFRAERQILARLRHPAIAQLLDGGLAPDGRPYFVLELVEGAPITEACDRADASLEDRIGRFVAVCDAVEAAHRGLVVHRDLKPSNILMTGDGAIKLLDFGVAKVLSEEDDGSERTRIDQRVLTPAYAAPEQILGEPVTTATDVYSLGVVLYELLTGERPHRRASATSAALAEELEHETIERPSAMLLRRRPAEGATPAPDRIRRGRRLRGDLDWIALRALAREPERRYPSAAALAADLRRYLEGRPVEAGPESIGYRLRKFVGRHRVAVAAAALVLGSLITGLAVALVQADRARREAERAVRVRDLMASIFERSTPEVTGEADVRASDLLEQGALQIEEELAAAEPAVASELLSTISGAFYHLGRFEDAERYGRRAIELLEREPATPATAVARERALRAVGEALLEQRRLDEAISALREGTERTRAMLGAEALQTAYAERAYAMALNQVGRHEEALALDEHVLGIYRRLLPAEHREVALHYISLGGTYDWLDRTEDSIRSYRRGIEMLERLLGPSHTQLADPLNNLAVVFAMADRFEEALPPIERAVAIRRASVPWGHSWLAFTLSQYSGILSGLDRFDESTEVATEMLAMLRANDPDDPNVPRALNRLAVDELRRGRLEAAAERFAEVFAVADRIGIASDDPRRLSWLSNASLADLELGRLADARARLDASLAGRRAQGGETRADFASALSPWGTLLRLEGDSGGAIEAHRRSIDLVESTRGPGHALADAARLELAEDLLARRSDGDVDAALAAAEPVRGRWASVGPADRPRVLDAELLVARCRLLRGEREAARAMLESLLPRQRARRGPESLPALETQIYLATARGADPAAMLARYADRRGASHWAVARLRGELGALSR